MQPRRRYVATLRTTIKDFCRVIQTIDPFVRPLFNAPELAAWIALVNACNTFQATAPYPGQ